VCFQILEVKFVITYINISLIITSVALMTCVVLQNKGVGMGSLTGSDTGAMFTARRGIEKTLFFVTISLSVLFFILTIVAVILATPTVAA
jgi:preprotein translocase subunit SecG